MNNTFALDNEIVDFIRQTSTGDCYGAYLRNTLMELMAIDISDRTTAADADRNDANITDWLCREINDLIGQNAVIRQIPSQFILAEEAESATTESCSAGRANLKVTVPGAGSDGGPGLILHAHIDQAAPALPPRSAGERVFGRGICEGQAQFALLLAQIKLLAEIGNKLGRKPTRERVYQFTIGGNCPENDAPSNATDEDVAAFPVLLLQPTGLLPVVGQFGWLSYSCRLTSTNRQQSPALEIFPFVVEEIEKESNRLRAESDHPSFDAARVRHYPTCLGSFVAVTERFCPQVAIEIVAHSKANPQRIAMKIIEFLEEAMNGYVGQYGDRAAENDPATGQTRLERHFDLRILPDSEAQRFRIDVFGCRAGGPRLDDGDNAIGKAAYLLGALLRIAGHFPAVQAFGRLLDDGGDDRTLILRGGQCFTANHQLDEVRQRLNAAARRGVENYCRARRQRFEPDMIAMDWDSSSHEAFVEPTDSAAVEALRLAFQAIGEPWPKPTAEDFGGKALAYHTRKHPVAVFGAGRPENIRWNEEYIDIPDLQKSLAISALAAWSLIR